MKEFMSEPLGQTPYQPFGDLWLEMPGHREVRNYQRQFDLDGAVATTSYEHDGVIYTRSIIASHPDQLIAVHLTASKPGSLSFSASLTTSQETEIAVTKIDDRTLSLTGKVDSYFCGRVKRVIESKVAFEARLQLAATGGTSTVGDGKIQVTGADSATLYLVCGTNYENFKSPMADPEKICKEALEAISAKTYEQVLAAHQADHRSLFRRCSIDLGGEHSAKLTTDERLTQYQQNSDPDVVSLLYQYGRYLLIASSRPGSQPANLQGLWNHEKSPAWDSKCTLNINAEMNYWPAELTNLSECHEPFFDLIQEVSETGVAVAQDHYGAKGWVAHHNSDGWRGAAPINHSNHGIWPTGGTWICTHLWEHFLYTGDIAFLRDRAYPLMKGAEPGWQRGTA